MSREIDILKATAGDYKKWALQARKRFIDLRLQQDLEIRQLYIKLTKNISNELKKEGSSKFNKRKLQHMYSVLKRQEDLLNGQLTINFEKYTKANVEVATGYSKSIVLNATEKAGIKKIEKPVIQKMFFRINERAVESIWSRTQNGLYLSDNIWNKCTNYRKHMTFIIQSAVAEGQDCVKTARAIEKYVLKGKRTLGEDYPGMMARMGSRIPEDISYEALRLARTEMTSAYGEATVMAGMVSPSCNGIKFILSGSHPKTDICDDITGIDKHGLGIGVYPIDEAPNYPFHPNCYDSITEVYTNEGWKLFKDLNGTEKILSINPKTDEIEWANIEKKISYKYTGDMIQFKSDNYNLLVTPNHRMYFKTRSGRGIKRRYVPHIDSAENLINRKEFQLPRVGKWEGKEPQYILINGIKINPELYCKLMGYFLSEGCAHKRKDNGYVQVTISQNSKDIIKIYEDLKGLPFHINLTKDHIYIADKRVNEYFLQFGKSYEKFVPNIIKDLSPRLIRTFLDSFRFGDGSERISIKPKIQSSGSLERLYFTSSRRIANDIEELILKVGNYPSCLLDKTKGKKVQHRNGVYTTNVDMYRIRENTSRNAQYSYQSKTGVKFKHVKYDDFVYDVQLDKNHVLWVKRNGKTCWSGNCLCITTTVNEQSEDFVRRLKKWQIDPMSEPKLEEWYQNIYKKIV